MIKIPEGYKLKEGDTVVAHLVVKHARDGAEDYIFCFAPGRTYTTLAIPIKEIQGIHAIKWEVGDKVCRGAAGGGEIPPPCCTVLAVHGDEVWVALPSGSSQTFKANDLRPWVEPEIEVNLTAPGTP